MYIIILGKMLRKQGHTVTEALNGEESLRKLAEVRNDRTNTMKPYDVVIIDLHMPTMDGKFYICNFQYSIDLQ